MNKTSYEIINTLKQFYSIYGEKNEEPLNELDLINILSTTPVISSDLIVLNKIIQNDKCKNQYTNCYNLLDNLANLLSNEALLMNELNSIKEKINFDIEGISNGIIWFQQAQEIGSCDNENMIINGLKIQGSLILKLYISLIYMREGPVYEILKIGSRNKCKIMNIYYKLFNSDYIRHIRNSLAHGTFKINIAGIHFIDDDKFEIVVTQGFLDKICIWLFIIYYQCVLFYNKKI